MTTPGPQRKPSRLAWIIPLIGLILAFYSLFALLPTRAESKDKPRSTDPGEEVSFVGLQQGLLSVKVHQVPLQGLLKEISRMTGVEIVVDRSITEKVSMQFENLPLDEGLKRLIGSSGVILVYGEPPSKQRSPLKPTLKKAIVLPRGKGVLAGKPGQGVAPSEQEKVASDPQAKALAALAAKKDVMVSLEEFLHQQDPAKKHKALDQLTELLTDDDLQTLIDLLQDQDFQAEEWEAALTSLKDVVRPDEAEFLMNALNNSMVRQYAADFFRQLMVERNIGPGSGY